jgi:four helix bundle protein
MAHPYRDLIAWQKAIAMVTDIYRAQGFPRQETYGLTSQIRRSAVSVPSNIAEGQGSFPGASSTISLAWREAR